MTSDLVDADRAGLSRRLDPTGGRPVVPARGALRSLGLHEVALTDGFWAGLQRTNADATLEHCERWMERLGWLANFDRVAAGGTAGAERPGWQFSDSEVYKLLEALAWESGRTGDERAEAAFRRLTARVVAAQDDDGYLNTCFGHAGQPPRYSDLEMGHELYCTGHLLQAAVARVRTRGADALVEAARRAADHVCTTFGADGVQGICGHPEIEVGLAELGRALDEPRYTEQARLFLDRRGHGTLADIPLGRAYFQDDVPIREADVWRGHAVRALYLSAAAVDVGVDTADDELVDAVVRQWERSVARRTYLTGGMGSRHQDEGFGEDWELSPDRAYCETCAGIASTMVSWRLFLATGDMRYADLIERTSYNVVATSPRSDGRAFFYANPLHLRAAGQPSDDDQVSPRAEGGSRAAWFDVSCCPTNVARTLASWHTYAAAVRGQELVLLQYAGGRIRTTLADGSVLALDVETSYPDDGAVVVRVLEAPATPVTLTFRVPAWSPDAVLSTPDGPLGADGGRSVSVVRVLQAGDELTLRLDVSPRLTWPDRRIDAVRGCVAVEAGPLVLCAEQTDVPAGIDLADLVVDASVAPVRRDGRVTVAATAIPPAERTWPYDGTQAGDQGERLDLPLIAYHRWAEREPGEMRVWLPVR
ncbi:beta-L-arabinofuranosidase domain-containing protein [Cellulomonas sp. 73-145]|uniref:glycoside hydrolase family 127 protein n=1 Tax=Cellulomonas sp. 73-145 TaxID=1895739 RepID=UPI000AFD7459|nr:beta-L-arabinofuranosidase domain-containing protein [Cellulomonas sp. 73-145]